MDSTQFYTYLWLRSDGTPYYVDKGSGQRAFKNQGRKVHRPESRSRILIQICPSEKEAFEKERWYISLFGRKDISTGILHNHTEGGEGASGAKRTEETKQKIRNILIGNKRNLGGTHTEEYKKKVSQRCKGIKLSIEHVEKLRSAHKGKPWSQSRRAAQEARHGQR